MLLARRLRGIVSTAVVWAVGWTAIAWPIFYVWGPSANGLARTAVALRLATFGGLAGAITGAAFAMLLIALERRRTLTAFPISRAILWGAVPGSAYFLLATTVAVMRDGGGESAGVLTVAALVGAVLGGASGSLMLLVARRPAPFVTRIPPTVPSPIRRPQ